MLRRVLLLTAVLGFGTASLLADDASDAYARDIETAHQDRMAKLITTDGWLTLIGLHFLTPGANTVGSAPDNQVVLAKGPAHLGTVTWVKGGKVSLSVAKGADVRVDGQVVRNIELYYGQDNTSMVTAGSVTFFVIERGGKKALRVRDSQSDRRVHFAGLDYYPTDASWRIEADWVAFDHSRQIPVTNVLGQTSPALVPGKAVFQRDGKTYELMPIYESPTAPLMFVVSDTTSGTETYGGGRFVYAEPTKDGKIVLDFNRAENPPCAFTPFATCPLPFKGNRLDFAVTAGEKVYRGENQATFATNDHAASPAQSGRQNMLSASTATGATGGQ